MNRKWQLVIILCTVVLITSIISHSIIAWLKIERSFGRYWVIGTEGGGRSSAFMAGSSLAGDGLSWWEISDVLNLRIEGWTVAGSSPSEWERFQHKVTQTKLTIVVVSPYDLNEYFLCDFRANLVPLVQTVKDLWQSKVDWPFCKHVLSLYPLSYLRILFPTAGRSDGVMVGFREKLKNLLRDVLPIQSEAGPTLALNESASTQEYKKEIISLWDPGRTLRRLASLRSACQGIHMYSGPKRQAFLRMLQQAQRQGGVVVVVLPVSPFYAGEFLTPQVKQAFEEVLAYAAHNISQVFFIRLDQLNALKSNDYFWDLVHMNIYGRQIATEAFLGQMRKFYSLP